MDLIDREALINFIDPGHLRHPGELCFSEIDVVNMLNHAPTIDAAHVVRCKDCKHWGMGITGETDRIKCCVYARYMVGENGYCVYGEKGGTE